MKKYLNFLKLLGNLVVETVVREPLQRRRTVGLVDFEGEERRPERQRYSCDPSPHPDPLADSVVLVDGLGLLEVEGRVGVHRGHLHEGLQLVRRVGRRSLDSCDPLERTFGQDRVTFSVHDVGELLVSSPLDVVVGGCAVVGVVVDWQRGKLFLVVDFLSLRSV